MKYVDNEPPVTAATIRFKFRKFIKRLLASNRAMPRYTVEVDTSEGVAWVYLSQELEVQQVHFTPCAPDGLLLPLWVAYPQYTSVTIFWRMCSGEDYKYKWHAWYRRLSENDRAKYKQRFPAPTDPERAWAGWYEEVADRPADGEHPIAGHIAGRV